MEILNQIQSDLLNMDVPLSATLRRAKVLASQLGSIELANWVSQELDGYLKDNELPDYRIINTSVSGCFTNGYWQIENRIVPTSLIKDETLLRHLTQFYVFDGIRTIEEYTKILGSKHIIVDPDLVVWVNLLVKENGYGYSGLHYNIGPQNFEQIIDTIKNRLLDFILKLDKQWAPKENKPDDEEIKQLVSIVIYNNPAGDDINIFDQRGQHIQYQFNASNEINIRNIKSIDKFKNELEKLREEIKKANQDGLIPNDQAIEAQYKLLEASKEVSSKKPNKSFLKEKINKTIELLKDISTLAGIVKSLFALSEIIEKLF